jgi:DNA polymerase I-like protein with 3'-5' exonuclease and polymerase domains
MYFVTGREDEYHQPTLEKEGIQFGDYHEFVTWINVTNDFQFDTETTMVESGPNAHDDRELLVLQLADFKGIDRWVFEWTELPEFWKKAIFKIFKNESKCFYGHNMAFDYTVVKAQTGVEIAKLHDTFLMSKVLNTGLTLPSGYHSLAGALERFFDIIISKDEQTTFTKEPLSVNQIKYAGDDVLHIGRLFSHLKKVLTSWELWDLYNHVERHVMKVYCDMELTPMRFDKEYWLTLSEELIADRDAILEELNDEIGKDPSLVSKLKTLKLIQPTDEYKINWNSSSQRKVLLSKLVPELPDDASTKPKIKSWFKDNKEDLSQTSIDACNHYLNRDYDKLNTLLVNSHLKWLEDNGFLIREGTLNINWNSPVDKLAVFNHYYPNLSDTNAKSLNRIKKNPIINAFKKYTSAQKRVTSYGVKFIDKYVRRDGMVAPFNFNQILNTGRISFGILLQIPGESKFRNAFYPPEEDWVFVDTDYSSAELVIMAFAAKEKAFLDATRDGRDLHCMSASLVFADQWKDVAEPGCVQLIDGSRCECPGHEKLRKFSKAISFGLALIIINKQLRINQKLYY